MEKEKQVYIILSDTGTWFTRLIRLYTKAPFNHASIAFDPDLSEVYSFGRKSPTNPFIGGFVKEDMRGELFDDALCAVYSCTVNESRYRRIRSIVQRFESESHQYKYNFIGLLTLILKIRFERKRAYFCSQFVASVFEQGGVTLVPKSSVFTTPFDLGCSKELRLTYQGELRSMAGMKAGIGI